jgi:hypothetical protein
MPDTSRKRSRDYGGPLTLVVSATAAWQPSDGGPDPLVEQLVLLRQLASRRQRQRAHCYQQLTGEGGLDRQRQDDKDYQLVGAV